MENLTLAELRQQIEVANGHAELALALKRKQAARQREVFDPADKRVKLLLTWERIGLSVEFVQAFAEKRGLVIVLATPDNILAHDEICRLNGISPVLRIRCVDPRTQETRIAVMHHPTAPDAAAS